MDSYVVRIYRRDSSSLQNLVGLVELVEINEERMFTNFEELRAILGSRQACIHEEKQNKESETV